MVVKGERNLLTYNNVFLEAWKNVLREYVDGKIKFLSHDDLSSHLFSESLRLMKTKEFEKPYKIYANKGVLRPNQKTDLVLGDNEVAIEVKFEPNHLLPRSRKYVVNRTDVEIDISKLDKLLKRGVKHAHFVMIDEDGHHMRNPRIREEWKTTKVDDREIFYLLVSRA